MADKDLEDRVRERVREMKGFYTHLVIYVMVNILIFLIWLFTDTGFPWFVFPLGGWGIGLFFHWYNVFVENGMLGRNWEEKKVRKLMQKEKQRERRRRL